MLVAARTARGTEIRDLGRPADPGRLASGKYNYSAAPARPSRRGENVDPCDPSRARGPERDPAAGPAAARARREPGLKRALPLLTSSPYLRSMALLDNMDLQQLMAGGDLNQEEAARAPKA